MGKKSGFGSGMNPIRIRHNFLGYLKYLKFFDAYLGSGMEKTRIRDKHPGSATLYSRTEFSESCSLAKKNA
jgi:hypothetical protein